jgi:hypothetical protein
LINLNTDDVKPDPIYLRYRTCKQAKSNTQVTGWQFHNLTPCTTKSNIEAELPYDFSSKFSARLVQPQLNSPRGIYFTTYEERCLHAN